jgi:hypothetical protein
MYWYREEQKQVGLAYLLLSSENRISNVDFALFENLVQSESDLIALG